MAAATAVLLGTANAGLLALRPFTIIRTRGQIICSADGVAASEEPQIVFGSIVVTDSAAAIGITAIPDPVSNVDGDWFVYEDCPNGFLNDVDGNTVWKNYPFDSKAMRKVGADDDIALVGANRSAADGGVLIVSGRMLLKLH